MKKCLSCNRPYTSKDNKSKYCSRSCAAVRNNTLAPKRSPIDRICTRCSETFTPGVGDSRVRCLRCKDIPSQPKIRKGDPLYDEYKDSQNKYMRERYTVKRNQLISYLGGKCVQCGCADSDVLEFDHIDPSTKSYDLDRYFKFSTERMMEEVVKLQLLCERCHIEKSAQETRNRRVCGTKTGWMKSKCECDLCTQAKLAWRSCYNEQRRNARKMSL